MKIRAQLYNLGGHVPPGPPAGDATAVRTQAHLEMYNRDKERNQENSGPLLRIISRKKLSSDQQSTDEDIVPLVNR